MVLRLRRTTTKSGASPETTWRWEPRFICLPNKPGASGTWIFAQTSTAWVCPCTKWSRANRLSIDLAESDLTRPVEPGLHVLDDYPLEKLVDFIDWTPFFRTWELAGKYPDILDDEVVGETASSLYRDARDMLDTIIREGWLKARAL